MTDEMRALLAAMQDVLERHCSEFCSAQGFEDREGDKHCPECVTAYEAIAKVKKPSPDNRELGEDSE